MAVVYWLPGSSSSETHQCFSYIVYKFVITLYFILRMHHIYIVHMFCCCWPYVVCKLFKKIFFFFFSFKFFFFIFLNFTIIRLISQRFLSGGIGAIIHRKDHPMKRHFVTIAGNACVRWNDPPAAEIACPDYGPDPPDRFLLSDQTKGRAFLCVVFV